MHAIEIVNGQASMAYRKQGGTPWHGLGTPLDGHQDLETMLREANADYDVQKLPVFVLNDNGEYTEIQNRFAVSRVNDDGTVVPFEVMKGRYHVHLNREVAQTALDIVGASEGDAVLETMGVLGRGEKFFVVVDLGTIVIDPNGAEDTVARYLMAATSHDGTLAITLANSNIRTVCQNTVTAAINNAKSVFRARHTPNSEDRIRQAREVLNLSTQWSEAFAQMANDMLSIDVPVGSQKVDTVLNVLFPENAEDTDRKKRNREAIIEDIRARYTNDKNVGKVGANGWALYNAIVEHHDWAKKKSPEKRTLEAIDSTQLIGQRKVKAQHAVLSLA